MTDYNEHSVGTTMQGHENTCKTNQFYINPLHEFTSITMDIRQNAHTNISNHFLAQFPGPNVIIVN